MPDNTVRVLYIASSGRSGSTILDRILGSAAGVVSGSELQRFWEVYGAEGRFCGCGQLVGDCPFWREVVTRSVGAVTPEHRAHYERLHIDLTRTRSLPRLWSPVKSAAFRRRLNEYRDLLRRFYRAVAEVSGAETIIDSSKGAGYGRVLSTVPGIAFSTLNLVRDSRAVAHSWTNRRPVRELREPWSVSYSGIHWLTEHTLIETLRSGSGVFRALRYEDFARNPAQTLQKIAHDFAIPLPPIDGVTVQLKDAHTIAGNRARHATGAVEIREENSWRAGFSLLDAAKVTAITWPMLLWHRYPLTYSREASTTTDSA